MYKWKQWEMNSIPTMEAESRDLALHTELCAARYRELDSRLGNLEVKIDRIGEKVDGFRAEMKKTLIITAGSIITTVIATLGVVLSKMI